MGAVTKLMDGIGNAIDHVFNALDPALEAIGGLVEKVIAPMAQMFANAVEHPIETIITAAAAAVGVPSYVTSAAITAAKGGSLEDIAKSAAMSYASTEFMSQTNIGAEINKVVGSAGGDFTDSMMKTFDLTPDQAVQLAKVSTAALNSSVMGGIKSALNGDSIAGGMASGFQSGLVYGSTDSFFSSINKDQNWGLSPTALNLVKGASSTALNTIISGKGDPAQAIGNYLGGAMINLGSSEFSKLAKSSYENLTGKVTAAQAAQDKYTALQDTYKAKVADSEEARTTINKTVEQINAIKTAEVDPIIAKITAAETDQNAANVEYYANKATYDKNKAVVDNYNDEMINRGFAAHDEFADGVLQYYKEEASDGENSPTRIYAPGIDTFYNDQKAAAVAANAAAEKSNAAGKSIVTLSDSLKPIQNKIDPLAATIASKTEFFNAIKADIETPAGNNLAAQMAAAANSYQIAYTEFQTAQTSANKAAENSAKQVADVAVRDALIGAVNSGAITVTGKEANGAYTLSNGMTIDSGGKFFQDGVPAFIDAAGVKQAPLDFKDNAGNKVDFNADAGRVMSTTDIQNALKRDYNITATEEQAKTLAGKPFTDVSSAEMKAFAEANGFQKVTPGDGIDPATGALHLTVTGTSTSGSNVDELSKDTINGLLSIGQSAKPPEKGGKSLFGDGSGSQVPNAAALLGIPSLLGVDDASGTSFSMTSNGYALITYSDGHSVAIDPKTQEPIWVNLADTKNALSGATDTDTKALAATINAIADPTIIAGIKPLPDDITRIIQEEITTNPTLKFDDIKKIVVDKLAADPKTTPEQVREIIRGLPTNKDVVDKAVTDTKTGTTTGTATGTAASTATGTGTTTGTTTGTGTTTAGGTTTGTGTTTTAGTGTATGTTQTAATTSLTPEQVTKIVNDAVAANPSLTADQVKVIVNTALASNPGVTIADVQNLISKIPAGVTTAQVQSIVNTSGDAAAAALNTAKEGLTKSIADLASGTTTSLNGIKESITALAAAGLTTEQVNALVAAGTATVTTGLRSEITAASTAQTTALDDAKTALAKSISDLSTKTTTDTAALAKAIADLKATGLTTDQVQALIGASTLNVSDATRTAINDATKNLATADDIKNAIAGIKFPAGLSATDVSDAISAYMKANPGLSIADVATKVTDITKDLPTTAGVQTAIGDALKGYATAKDIETAISGITFPAGLSKTDVSDAISTYMKENPGLSIAQVATKVAEATAGLATTTGVNTAISDALKGYATAADITTAKESLQKSIADLSSGATTNFNALTKSISDLAAAGLTEAQVKALVEAGTSSVSTDLKAAISTASGTTITAIADAKTELATAISDLSSKTTTDMTAVNKAITDLQAAGLTTAQVEALVNTGTTSVESKLKTAIADAATTQSTALDTAKSDLTKAIGDLSSKTTTDMAGVNAAIAALAAAGLTTDQVQKIVDTSSAGVTTDLKDAITAAGTAQTTALNDAKTALTQSITDLSNKTTTDMAGVNQAIADLKAAGLTTDQVNALINTGAANVTTDLKAAITAANTAQSTALDTAKADLTKAIGDLSSKTTTDTSDLKQAISDLRAAGLTEAQVKSIVETQTAGVSTDVKAAITDASTGMATALEKAKTDLSKSITDLASGTATGFDSLKDSIAALKASGLTEAQVQKLVDAGSANVSTDLKAAIANASAEQATALDTAKAGLTKSIADLASGTSTGFETLNKSIADLKAAGLTEAQVKALVDAGTSGVTTDLKAAIKTASEAATTQIAGVTADLQAKYDAMTTAQKAEVAARQQQGIDLSAAIAAESTAVQAKLAELGTDVQSQYNKLTTAQKEEVDARSLQGTTLAQAITDASQATKTQIEGLAADTQEKYNTLTAAQKAEVDARIQQGVDVTKAINDTAAATQTQITSLSADTQAKYDTLTAAQKATVDALGKQGQDLTSEINRVYSQTQTQITGLTADTQAKYDALTAAQKAEVQARVDQGADLTRTINEAAVSTQTQIAGLGADLQAKYGSLTVAQKAEVDARVQQGADLTQAINAAATATQTQIAGVSADFQAKLAASDTATQQRFSQLTDAQKAQAEQLSATTGTLQDAIAQAAATTTQQIAGVSADFQAKLAASDAATQAGFGRLTDAQKAQAEQLATTTGDLKSAIAQASATTTQQIAGVSADFQAKLAASDQATQDRFNQLTDAQKAQAAQLATSTGNLQTAIAQAAATTTQQIAGLTADMQSKYDAMTATQKADVAALQAQGQTLQDAIASTAAATQTQIAGLSADLQTKYDAMTAAQKAEVAARQAQGVSLEASIQATASATQAQITGLSADLQAKYDAMTAAQKAEVANREAQGTTLAEAIKTTAETTQTQITNTQTQFNTRVDQLVTQGQTQQAATDTALKELNAGLLGVQTEQQAAKDAAAAAATEAKRASAQTSSNAGLAAAMGILGGTVGAVGQIGSKTAAAPVIDDTIPAYKKIGFTSTGDTAKYVSPLEQYLKQVMGDSYANPQQQAAPVNQAPEQQPSSAFSYGQETNIDDMLASSTLPEMGNYQSSMYSSKKGGLVPPLMAAGGSTRYGKYAGGGLNTVNFQGKTRIDFRRGNAVTGPGDGQSDDIPAMLADGEFVFPADVVAALGNGSTKAGSDKLYDMMHSIRSHSRSTDPKKLPPPAKSPLDYLNKRARR